MRINKLTTAILITIGVSFTATADVRVISENLAVNSTNNANQMATFSQIGFSGEKYPIFKGFGQDMPLEIALQAIVPKTFEVKNNNPDLNVSFKGGTTWPYVLEQISKKYKLAISIDYNKMIVDVYSDKINKPKDVILPEVKSAAVIQTNNKVEKMLAHKEQQINSKNSIEQKILEKQKEDQRLAGVIPAQHDGSINKVVEKNKNKEVIQPSKNVTITVTNTQNTLTGGYTQEEFSKLSPQEKTNVLLGLSHKNAEKLQHIVQRRESIEEKNKTQNSLNIAKETLAVKEEVKAIVQPTISSVNLVALKEEYNKKFVLPIDPSFDFYVQGGSEEKIDYNTPATYLAKTNLTLEENLAAWAKEIGWTLEWKTAVRYPIKYPMTMKGSFKETSLELINLFKNSKRPLNIAYYPKSKVVVVTDLNHKIK